jgi:hypothetical protein
MVELIFLIYVLPRRMARLARERNRSTLWWSLAAIGAWVGAELCVGLGLGAAYGAVGYLRGRTVPSGLADDIEGRLA